MAELGGELIAPLINIDSKIAITPKNASNKIVQEFMSAKNAILRVTSDGRVGLQVPRGVSLLGFDQFLMQRGVNINDPSALDGMQVVISSDPLKKAKLNHVKDIRKALRRKDWDALDKRRVKEELTRQPSMEVEQQSKDNKNPKLRAEILTLFSIFKQTGALINTYVIEPYKRATQQIYAHVMRPAMAWMFGQIQSHDEYEQTEKELYMRMARPKGKQAIVEVPSDSSQNIVPQMVWSYDVGNDSPSVTTYTFQSPNNTGNHSNSKNVTATLPLKLRTT